MNDAFSKQRRTGKGCTIPVIDLFAGPGGLAEGFCAFNDNKVRFDVRLSIEMDPVACRTLTLRKFFRAFPRSKVPPAYYDYVRGDPSKLSELIRHPKWAEAVQKVRQWKLGAADESVRGYVPLEQLHSTISAAIGGADSWVLLGGPPCQAYSLAGRSRMSGVGTEARLNAAADAIGEMRFRKASSFATDHRHTLYREYLRVVALHQPAIFVMENVKGILSSKIAAPGKSTGALVFNKIRQDLSDPWESLRHDADFARLTKIAGETSRPAKRYRLRSFVERPSGLLDELSNSDFVVRSELYGVPQQRHRVIVVGIREDIHAEIDQLVPAAAISTVRSVIGALPKIRSALSTDAETRELYGADNAANWLMAISSEIAKALPEIADGAERATLERLVERKRTSLIPGGRFLPGSSPMIGAADELREWIEDPAIEGVIQHESRTHMAPDLARYAYLSASAQHRDPARQKSPNLRFFPKSLLPKHANVRSVSGARIVDGFLDRFRVQVWDRPSSTVMSHLQKDGHYFIHPDVTQCRSITVREAARLQTFPDNYFFEGNRGQQFQQIGNAVPPYLALQLARSVAAAFS